MATAFLKAPMAVKRKRTVTTTTMRSKKRRRAYTPVARRRFRTRRRRYAVRKRSKSVINPTFNRLTSGSATTLRQAFVKFHYDASIPFSTAVTALNVDLERFRANSIVDPYAGTGGTKVRNYDAFLDYFTRYTVVRAKIKVYFVNDSTESCVYFLQTASNDSQLIQSNSIVNISSLTNRNDTKVLNLSGRDGGKNKGVLKYYVNIPQLLDEDPDSDLLEASYSPIGDDPTLPVTFTVGRLNPPYLTEAVKSYFSLRITYYTRLHRSKQAIQTN